MQQSTVEIWLCQTQCAICCLQSAKDSHTCMSSFQQEQVNNKIERILCDSIRAKLKQKMTQDTDQSRLVTFESNLWVGGLRQKKDI